MDITFVENESFFQKFSSRGKRKRMKIIFGMLIPLPNTILEQTSTNPILDNGKQSNISPTLPSIINIQSSGETLQEKYFELQVHNRTNNHTKEKDLSITLAQS